MRTVYDAYNYRRFLKTQEGGARDRAGVRFRFHASGPGRRHQATRQASPHTG